MEPPFHQLLTVYFFLQNSQNPLHEASHNGHIETVHLLIDRGTEVDASDKVASYPGRMEGGKRMAPPPHMPPHTAWPGYEVSDKVS